VTADIGQFTADPLFGGRFDDFRFVSSALSDAQVAAIYNTPPPLFRTTTIHKPDAFVQQPYSATLAGDAIGVGPLTFSNNRNGGYVQLSYRPSRVNNFLRDFEGVVRFDDLIQRKTPVGFDEKRWTFGLDYWLTPSTVVKLAYEIDSRHGDENQNAIMLQVATGF
jgi:hypothetical protein